jgi:hypothetical protein
MSSGLLLGSFSDDSHTRIGGIRFTTRRRGHGIRRHTVAFRGFKKYPGNGRKGVQYDCKASIALLWSTLCCAGLCNSHIVIHDFRLKITPLSSSVIDFSNIHQLFTPGAGNLVWYSLLHKCLVCRLHSIHAVSGAWDSCSEIMYARCSRHFENKMLAT